MNRRFKFGNRHLYEVPGVGHLFSHEQDAVFYCAEHGIDKKSIAEQCFQTWRIAGKNSY